MNEEYIDALAHFKKSDPILYVAAKKYLPTLSVSVPIKTNQKLFETLCESVVSQQLSVKAADTIWNRLKKTCGGKVTVESIAKTPLPSMREAGLSGAKAKTLQSLANAIAEGLILSSLRKKTAKEAEKILTNVWGIGPWTTEMFLMFGLNHPDIFSNKDLGLIRSMEALYGISQGTPLSVFDAIAEKWSPYRTTACRVLWRARDAKN